MKTISEAQLHKMLCRAVKESGSQKVFAALIGISPQYLSDIMTGRKPISLQVLDYFGLERVVFYRKARK